ncbi:LytTR family DNA-binding domain-containing protein [Roseovarius sp. A-2]|uniref:LytTR family DNA-binding domain-containing protein n=1 Tax=Roseovarius sp. A-2 TaxID=1570360 RepID=UPI00159321B5|nr:LytTR family DNA-binding domain-containing protein [Roseovarius sp. A-2]
MIAVVAGPFGTYDTMMWPTRLAYWGLVASIGILIGSVARAIKKTVCVRPHPAVFDAVVSLLTSLFLAPAIWLLRGTLDPQISRVDLSLFSISLNTVIVVGSVFVLRRLFGLEQPASYAVSARVSKVPLTRLHRRLSDWPDAEIMRLSANDHFVEVATSHGTETVRLRLGDAIDEMEPVKGFCTHRSHWVALCAIERVERDGARLFVSLRNGDRVPVSRKYRPRLEQAGLIDRADGQGG